MYMYNTCDARVVHVHVHVHVAACQLSISVLMKIYTIDLEIFVLENFRMINFHVKKFV